MSKKIHLDAPNVGELEKLYLNRAIDSGYISSVGPAVNEFEEKCADYLHLKRAVATNSGTSSIHIALYELGIGKGDEVIVPALTFVATVNPVRYVGADPVIVDVAAQTWNMDPEAVEKAVTEKTKAIIAVHLYGNPCDMNEINRIAKKHNLYVIEDAAESLGARYGGRLTGALSDFGCFSFNGNKTMTTGGGGVIVGNEVERLEHIKYLINQARDDSEEISHSEIGFNYRMMNLQAALGLAQFERLQGFLEKKKAFNNIYKDEMKELKTIQFQEEYETAESSYWFTCIKTGSADTRHDLQERLKQRGVPTRRIFTPINEFPPYRDCRFIDNGNAHSIFERGICLPGSTLNDIDDIKYVSETLKEFCSESSAVG